MNISKLNILPGGSVIVERVMNNKSTIFDQKLSGEDVEKTIILPDFLKYLSYLKEKPAKLTATGNLTLRVIGEISKFISIPKHFAQHNYPIRSQREWPYLDQLDALAEVGKFTLKRKGYRRLAPRGRAYLGLLPGTQLGELFLTYWEYLNWHFLFPYVEEKKDQLIMILYRERASLLSLLRDFKKDAKGWIDFLKFAEHLRKSYNLKLLNYLGQDLPSRVHVCIARVLLEPFFGFGLIEVQGKRFDHHRLSPSQLEAFRVTNLGEGMLDILLPDKPVLNLFASFFSLN